MTCNPRANGFNYGTGWGSGSKPAIYEQGIALANRLGKHAMEASRIAWQVEVFTVFNVAQIEGLPTSTYIQEEDVHKKPEIVDTFIASTRADIRIGGDIAGYIVASHAQQFTSCFRAGPNLSCNTTGTNGSPGYCTNSFDYQYNNNYHPYRGYRWHNDDQD